MRYIVSTTLNQNYTKYKVVKSLVELQGEVLENCDCIILHNLENDSYESAGLELARLYSKGVQGFVYINANLQVALKAAVAALRGYISDEEFYLEDEGELDALVDLFQVEGGETGTELALANAKTVGQFIEDFVHGSAVVQAPQYMARVKQAVSVLEETVTKFQIEKLELCETHLDVYLYVNKLLEKYDGKRKELELTLKALQEAAGAESMVSRVEEGVTIYPGYRFDKNVKTLVVREWTPCPYLTSFLLAFKQYLEVAYDKRVKFIVIHQKGRLIYERYPGDTFTAITKESQGDHGLYLRPVINTNIPNKDVMRRLFENDKDVVDINIVLDRTYSEKVIVSGRSCRHLNAVGGDKDIDTFKLDVASVIKALTTSRQGDVFVSIPYIEDYVRDNTGRFSMYTRVCKEARFEKLCRYLDIK